MAQLVVLISLFSVLFGGLLGVYALGFKIMKDVNKKIDGHVSDTKVHVDPEHPLVTGAVCAEIQKRNELHFDNLANGQQEIKDTLKLVWEKLK